jgi:hypothetical protein
MGGDIHRLQWEAALVQRFDQAPHEHVFGYQVVLKQLERNTQAEGESTHSDESFGTTVSKYVLHSPKLVGL